MPYARKLLKGKIKIPLRTQAMALREIFVDARFFVHGNDAGKTPWTEGW
jgi:hypothetical protein